MDNHSEIIVIVGFGWVGQANALALIRMGYLVSFYDVVTPKFHYYDTYNGLYDQLRSLNMLLEKDSQNTWYIVCIGDRVDKSGNQDISLIKNALEILQRAQGKTILRSTVLPTILDTLSFDIYLPEFLHEIRAVEECLNPYYFVIGHRREITLPSFLQAWQSRACKVFQGTPQEASYVKYLSNIWNAVRIAFVNEFGNTIALPETVAIRKETERIIDFIFEGKSYVRYGQAFGGHCLPKDLRAYIRMSAERISTPLLKGVAEANQYHAQVVNKYHTLTQWFSTWDYQYFNSYVGGVVMRFWTILNATKPVRRLRRFVKPIILFVEQKVPHNFFISSTQYWDRLAKKNPYYYAHPDTKSSTQVDEFEIRESGEADFNLYILQDELLRHLLKDFSKKQVLEIGSGVGRMTEFFAKNFENVYSLDISETMLGIAKKRLALQTNIIWLKGDGEHITVDDERFDFIFSYDVFKYVQSFAIIKNYIVEIVRSLKPGGIVKMQFRTGPETHRWRWFHGISFLAEEVRQLFERAGLTVLKIDQENLKSLWIIAQKS